MEAYLFFRLRHNAGGDFQRIVQTILVLSPLLLLTYLFHSRVFSAEMPSHSWKFKVGGITEESSYSSQEEGRVLGRSVGNCSNSFTTCWMSLFVVLMLCVKHQHEGVKHRSAEKMKQQLLCSFAVSERTMKSCILVKQKQKTNPLLLPVHSKTGIISLGICWQNFGRFSLFLFKQFIVQLCKYFISPLFFTTHTLIDERRHKLRVLRKQLLLVLYFRATLIPVLKNVTHFGG